MPGSNVQIQVTMETLKKTVLASATIFVSADIQWAVYLEVFQTI